VGFLRCEEEPLRSQKCGSPVRNRSTSFPADGVARSSVRKPEELATRRLALERYQSIDDTIVQLFISQASVLMARIDRI
jgi:hypothetical protein